MAMAVELVQAMEGLLQATELAVIVLDVSSTDLLLPGGLLLGEAGSLEDVEDKRLLLATTLPKPLEISALLTELQKLPELTILTELLLLTHTELLLLLLLWTHTELLMLDLDQDLEIMTMPPKNTELQLATNTALPPETLTELQDLETQPLLPPIATEPLMMALAPVRSPPTPTALLLLTTLPDVDVDVSEAAAELLLLAMDVTRRTTVPLLGRLPGLEGNRTRELEGRVELPGGLLRFRSTDVDVV